MCSRIFHPIGYHAMAAFSLIEIVLAVGVISFALVGILGLFPVALQTATNSQRETQAALIARSIFSDLESQSGEKRFLLRGKDDTPTDNASSGEETSRFSNRIDIDLTQPGNYYLAYDADGLPLEDKISASDYSSGSAKVGFFAKVTVIEPAASTTPGISQLEVIVGAPGEVSEGKRKSYPFVSLLNNGRTAP